MEAATATALRGPHDRLGELHICALCDADVGGEEATLVQVVLTEREVIYLWLHPSCAATVTTERPRLRLRLAEEPEED